MAQKSYRDILLDHFMIRRKKGSQYSLRAYARDLNLYPSHLSAVLLKKRGLSTKTAVEIAESLNLSSADREEFVDLVNSEHARSVIERNRANQRLTARTERLKQKSLDTKGLDFFNRWYYAAAWQLVYVSRGKGSLASWAKALGISETEMNEALEFLVSAGYLKNEDGIFTATDGFFAGSSPTPQKVIRQWHTQILNEAAKRIENLEQRQRKNAATIMAFDASRSEEARAYLQQMHDDFITKFQPSDDADAVYAISVNLFQLDSQGAPT